MRKKLLTLSLTVTALTLILGSVYNNAHTNPTGAPNGRTGSPGDNGNTCAISGCHTGIAVTTRPDVITSNIPQDGYTPGTKYTITATARSIASRNTFGFQISPQSLTGQLLGTVTITNSTETQVTGGGKYVTHKQAGITGSNGTKTWTFDWTAPAQGTGEVVFYGCFNHANGNNGSTGDSIIKSIYTVQEKIIATVSNDALSKLGFTVFPNPANDALFIQNNHGINYTSIELFSLDGKLVYSSREEVKELTQKIDLSEIPRGIYLIKLSNGGEILGSKKMLLQ